MCICSAWGKESSVLLRGPSAHTAKDRPNCQPGALSHTNAHSMPVPSRIPASHAPAQCVSRSKGTGIERTQLRSSDSQSGRQPAGQAITNDLLRPQPPPLWRAGSRPSSAPTARTRTSPRPTWASSLATSPTPPRKPSRAKPSEQKKRVLRRFRKKSKCPLTYIPRLTGRPSRLVHAHRRPRVSDLPGRRGWC